MSVCAKFEECAAKPVGRVGFFNEGLKLKFKMGDCIDTVLMCVKFGDDPISSLDFSFIGGV